MSEAPLPPFRRASLLGEADAAGQEAAPPQPAAAPARPSPTAAGASAAPGGGWEPSFQNGGESETGYSTFGSRSDGAGWSAKDPDAPYVAAPLADGWEPVGAGLPA